MHPYFLTPFQPWQTFNPIDLGMPQRPFPWFDPSAYQPPYNHAVYRCVSGFRGEPVLRRYFPPTPLPRAFCVLLTGVRTWNVPIIFPGFGVSEYLSPENFTSSFGKTAGNYLPPEFLEFLRAELLRCGKALRTVAPALEHENGDVKEQAHLAATAQFFYALGLLYTRGLIIPPDVPGTSSRAEESSPVTACEVFGEALERFAREQFLGRGTGRELGELSDKARICFHALAPDSEQLERARDENIRLGRKKAVNA